MKIKKYKSKSRSKQSHNLIPKLFFIISSIGILGYLLYLRLPKAVPISINEVGNLALPTVTLSFPPNIFVPLNSQSSVDLTIDSENAKVSAIQVEIKYDPSSLSNLSITQGDFLTEKLGNPSIKDGIISFVYVTPLSSQGKSGTGKLATISFQATKDNSTLSFSSNTMVAVIGSSDNALKTAIGTTIQTSQTTNSAPPPVLNNLTTSPTTSSKPKPASNQNNPQVLVSPETGDRVQNSPKERIFDETGNFKNQPSSPVNLVEDQAQEPSTQSAFSRFISFVKKILEGNNVEK